MPPVVNFNLPPNTQKANPRKLVRTSDGDTPVIEQPIRMVSCDTPEKAGYAGNPTLSQPKLDTCRQRLQGGFYPQVPAALSNYLIAKLTPDAAQRHVDAGYEATRVFDQLLESRLLRPDGNRRNLGIIATGEILDTYGRMLAYFAPWYSGVNDPLPPIGDPRRDTLNLNMIENGWAAFFPVYPSLPKNLDMNRAIAAAEAAWDNKAGAWAQFGNDFLLAYEYRACIKLGTAATSADGIANAFQRACVDLRNLRVMGKFGFDNVPPCYRLWVWEDDLAEAIPRLGLVP